MAVERLPIVGVMGDGKRDHPELSTPLGQALAQLGVHLLTGAGRGVMCGVCRAFAESTSRRGLVIGIVPSRTLCAGMPYEAKDGYPNEFIEVPIFTHLPGGGTGVDDPLTRNHINVLSSDFVIALPGGPGTALETALARAYGKPLYVLEAAEQLEKLVAMLEMRFSASLGPLRR